MCIRDRPIPVPGPGEVLVKVRASGLCVSDIHIQDGKIGTVHPVSYTHLIHIRFCGAHRLDERTVAHDSDIIRNAEDFLHLMGNVDDAFPLPDRHR